MHGYNNKLGNYQCLKGNSRSLKVKLYKKKYEFEAEKMPDIDGA